MQDSSSVFWALIDMADSLFQEWPREFQGMMLLGLGCLGCRVSRFWVGV